MSCPLDPFVTRLDHALSREQATPPMENQDSAITSGMRDGSAHVLRCLKVWYDLPTDVFFNAVESMDKFLAKMKAQPKHLSCIAVSAFHLACQNDQQQLMVPEPSDLVTISQSRCSPSDLLRMQAILSNKLGVATESSALTLLRVMHGAAVTALRRLNLPNSLTEELPAHLVHQLEILACDSKTWLAHRPAEIALSLLAASFQRCDASLSAALTGVLTELQKRCGVSASRFVSCLSVVVAQLEKYNGDGTVTHRQRLVWKLSGRTMRHLRPTCKLRLTLPTIKEDKLRQRSNSECSEESMASLSDESDRDVMEEDEECFK